ncbi:uncharacterized protein RJT21DRAFT_121827 [Scheffersomyces amazonensis]|uniref:uncharacterized protein n=1 Tax=Scheffersomyces amazonensis TaxID=1078765 RepID=UPI00315D5FC7
MYLHFTYKIKISHTMGNRGLLHIEYFFSKIPDCLFMAYFTLHEIVWSMYCSYVLTTFMFLTAVMFLLLLTNLFLILKFFFQFILSIIYLHLHDIVCYLYN